MVWSSIQVEKADSKFVNLYIQKKKKISKRVRKLCCDVEKKKMRNSKVLQNGAVIDRRRTPGQNRR